jgi:hypothetical protein
MNRESMEFTIFKTRDHCGDANMFDLLRAQKVAEACGKMAAVDLVRSLASP